MSYASEAIRGFGTILQVSIASVFTNVWEILSITPPEYTMDPIDITHMESPDNMREFMGSLGESGELAFKVQYKPTDATHKFLLSLRGVKTPTNFKIKWTDTAVSPWTFAGLLTAFGAEEITVDGKCTAQCKFKISGLVTTPA